jgi:hypothetical protein
MNLSVEYLIQKFADARDKMHVYNGGGQADVIGLNYWRGVMDTYHNLLSVHYDEWAAHGTIGWYVFHEQMSFDEALKQVTEI